MRWVFGCGRFEGGGANAWGGWDEANLDPDLRRDDRLGWVAGSKLGDRVANLYPDRHLPMNASVGGREDSLRPRSNLGRVLGIL